jgi:Virulence factor BrkB
MVEPRRLREQWRELTRRGKVFEQDQAANRDRYLADLRAELTSAAPAAGWHAWWARWVVIPGALFARRVVVDDVGTHAGALTYASILSIPPLLVFAASVLGLLLAGSPSAQKAVIDAIASLVPADIQSSTTNVLQSQMSAAISGKVSFGLVGLLGLLWSASGLSARLRHALGLIFGTARAGLWSGRVVGALIGLFVVVSLLGVAILSGLQTWVDGPWSNGFLSNLAFQVAILLGQFRFHPGHVPGVHAGRGAASPGPRPGSGRVHREIPGAAGPRRHLLRGRGLEVVGAVRCARRSVRRDRVPLFERLAAAGGRRGLGVPLGGSPSGALCCSGESQRRRGT